jgi:hypothetical protein
MSVARVERWGQEKGVSGLRGIRERAAMCDRRGRDSPSMCMAAAGERTRGKTDLPYMRAHSMKTFKIQTCVHMRTHIQHIHTHTLVHNKQTDTRARQHPTHPPAAGS